MHLACAHTKAALCCMALLAAAGDPLPAKAFPSPGEWPCWRGNSRLDARATIRGHIVQPQLVWQHFVGSVDTHWIVEPGGEGGSFLADPAALPSSAPELSDCAWGLTPPLADFGGKMQPLYTDSTTTFADVIPGVPGLEKLQFESGFNIPTVNGQWQPCRGRCYAWRDGQWVQVWESPLIDMLFVPLPVAGDFDADGNLEVAILPWRELLILDARTGTIKDRCPFTEGRSYGFFGVYDLDSDGLSEFLVMADFCKHVDVLGYRQGKLSVLWQREIELDISNPQKIMRVNPRPAADVDGDGRLEVLVCVYNDAGDQRWQLTVYEGMTGAVKAVLPDQYLQGVHDLDADGVHELLTTTSSTAGVPTSGTLRVWSLRGGAPSVLWEMPDAAWVTWTPPSPLNVNNGATLGATEVLCRRVEGRAKVLVRQHPEVGEQEGALIVGSWQDGAFTWTIRIQSHCGPRDGAPYMETPGRPQGAEGLDHESTASRSPKSPARRVSLTALGLDESGRVLLRTTAPPGYAPELSVSHGSARPVASRRHGAWSPQPIVVRPGGSDRPVIVAPGAGEEVVALQISSDATGPVELWRYPGRGQSTQWPHDMLGPVAGDLLGDGGRQLLVATQAPSGCARLVALHLAPRRETESPALPAARGAETSAWPSLPSELWHHDFPEIPGGPPFWNIGGLILWQVGHFTDPSRMDVLFTVRRSYMHSEESGLLSGVDGSELWRRERQIDNRGVGGTPFAVADFDGDGLDDATLLHPSEFTILRGATGQDILARPTTWPEIPCPQVYWGQPIVGNFERTGRPSVFFATTRASMTGLLRADGSVVWWDALDVSPNSLPAFADVDGDGVIEAIGFGYPDGIRCYDTATGAVKWRMESPIPGTPAGVASGDINSDGRDEVVVTCGNTVYCLAATKSADSAFLLWQLPLSSPLGPPVIADVDGNGLASILVMGSDGLVTCLR